MSMLGFCTGEIRNGLAKLMPLRVFQASVANSLVEAHERKRGRPFLEANLTPVLTKLVKIQSTPTDDVRKDDKKSESVAVNALMVKPTFHVENAMHGFDLTKTEPVLVHTMDISKRMIVLFLFLLFFL